MLQTEHVVTVIASPPALVWMLRLAWDAHTPRSPAALLQSGLLFLSLLGRRRELGRWRGDDAAPLREMLALRPGLATVVRRPYISTGWSAARRVLAVTEHYRLVGAQASALKVRPEQKAVLASVAAGSGAVAVVLDSPAWFVHEGELALNLFHGDDRIYTIAFSLGFDRGEAVAYVGALQGCGKAHARALYRSLTHELHALRPRDLLIAAFRTVCREIGVERWLAVGNDRQVSASPYFRREAGLQANYDEAWTEQGGARRADGLHVLSSQARRRCHEEIPARKRGVYRRRYAMLDRLDAELAQALAARRLAAAGDARLRTCDDAAVRPLARTNQPPEPRRRDAPRTGRLRRREPPLPKVEHPPRR